ncbi:MAG: 30S ribosomal protein S13 [Thermoplasmataceae archaeon]|jgi:small subunit ribosomal protein S13|nr:30S ribosomal protein S13 [Candidatus Thermoplasmatota archaeon]
MADDKKVAEKKEDFLYIVRIGSKDLDGERNVKNALADLKGIGDRLSMIIVKKLGLDPTKKIGDMKEPEIEKIREFVESKSYEGLPDWVLNHRNEIISGEDMNLISNDLTVQLQEDLNFMKKMKSYKGVRHETGHKVRGQRTKANGRHGLAIGVVKKKE